MPARFGHFAVSAVLTVLMVVAVSPALAHHDENDLQAPTAPATNAPVVQASGTVEELVIDDQVAGLTVRYLVLRTADGGALSLRGANLGSLTAGMGVQVAGRRNGTALFVDAFTATTAVVASASRVAGPTTSVTGTLHLWHWDDLDGAVGEFRYAVRTNDDRPVHLDLPVLPEVLQRGMRVRAEGNVAADGSVQTARVTVLALAPEPVEDKAATKATKTNQVLVIPIKFATNTSTPYTYAADPFPVSQIQTAVFGGTGTNSVAEFYKEVSYGQQLLAGTVANNGAGGWLVSTSATPTTCDTAKIEAAAQAAATARGYVLANYQNLVYLFSNNVPGCGWSGLAYIGWGRAYIKQTTNLLVIAHELGHNFGLLHAASLRCTGAVIGGSCSSSEYGDPFDVMGNIGAMHFNAMQKSKLSWIAPSTVITQTAGVGAYSLAPLELAGGTRYAVTIPTTRTRTYWAEYRQPIGFDAGLSSKPNNGAQVRVGLPFESLCSSCADDTEILDMTPATSTHNDATLLAGRHYIDPLTGVSMSVMGTTPTSMSLLVQVDRQNWRTDFNGDGKNDLLWRNAATGVTVLQLLNGAAVTGGGPIMTDPEWVVLNTGDFDGDGKTDILWRNTTTGATVVWLMNGAAIKAGGALVSDPLWLATQVGDFDGDGKDDIVWRNLSTGQTVLWLMNGLGVKSGVTLLADPNWVATYTGDFNGDGKADIVWRNVTSGQTVLWLMNGGAATSSATLMTDANWSVTHVGDFNGDGKADIVWRNNATGATALWLMNGKSIIAGGALLGTAAWHVTHVGDINGDGKDDIVWRNVSTGATALWLMNGTAIAGGAALMSDANWSINRLADINGDGKLDIIWRNTTSSQSAAWLMNGLTPLLGFQLTTDANWYVRP